MQVIFHQTIKNVKKHHVLLLKIEIQPLLFQQSFFHLPENKAIYFFVHSCSAHHPLDNQQISSELCIQILGQMFFKTHSRINPQTGRLSIYYRLVENNRNAVGGISQRSIIGVGFMDDVSTEELHLIADGLNERLSGQVRLIANSEKVAGYVEHLYGRLLKEKRIDRILESRKRMSDCDWQRIDMNSVNPTCHSKNYIYPI